MEIKVKCGKGDGREAHRVLRGRGSLEAGRVWAASSSSVTKNTFMHKIQFRKIKMSNFSFLFEIKIDLLVSVKNRIYYNYVDYPLYW